VDSNGCSRFQVNWDLDGGGCNPGAPSAGPAPSCTGIDNCLTTPTTFLTPPGDDDCDGWTGANEACPTTPTPWKTPTGDADCDSFTSAIETAIGTDPADNCPNTPGANDEVVDAWPPDTNDDRFVNITDVNSLRPPVFNLLLGRDTVPTNPSYSQRKDFNNDGFINITDVNALRPPIFNLLVPCTP
jgi:hypothetical protein